MINRDMKIGEVIARYPETITVFQEFGLDCMECQIAEIEDVGHGAGVHKVDIEKLLEALNRAIEN